MSLFSEADGADGAPASVLQLLGYLDGYELQQRSDAAFALNYPNLTKETEVKARANEVFQFLEFLAARGVNLAKYGDGDPQREGYDDLTGLAFCGAL